MRTFNAICYVYSRHYRPPKGDSTDPFTLSMYACRLFGLNKQGRRSGLKALESAGLIEVFRRPSRNPMVRPIWFDLEPLPNFVDVVGQEFTDTTRE